MNDFLTSSPFHGRPDSGVRKNMASLFQSRKNWKDKKIIDLCCGDGTSTFILRKLGAKVFPYDLTSERCELKEKPKYINVQKKFPIKDKSVDIVIFQEVIEHLPNQLFTLEEIYRILKPGGEVIITTPSKSSIGARLSYLVFESEHHRFTPWGSVDAVWGSKDKKEKYYGHLWLIGIQQINALGKIAGFKKIKVHKTELSSTSIQLFIVFYPLILFFSLKALSKDLKKSTKGSKYYNEKIEQFKLNISLKTLLSKYTFVSLYK